MPICVFHFRSIYYLINNNFPSPNVNKSQPFKQIIVLFHTENGKLHIILCTLLSLTSIGLKGGNNIKREKFIHPKKTSILHCICLYSLYIHRFVESYSTNSNSNSSSLRKPWLFWGWKKGMLVMFTFRRKQRDLLHTQFLYGKINDI